MQPPDDLLDDVIQSARLGGGCYLGVDRGRRLYSGAGRSTLVLGPSRSGKTTSILIPNVLGHPGPVVATSTKDELLHVVEPTRRRRGTVALYDPSGTVPCPRSVLALGWSPLDGAVDVDVAAATAMAMVDTSLRVAGVRHSHWSERAATLLTTLLHAAALEECPMARVLAWVDRHDPADARTILARTRASTLAIDALEGICATEDREQSSIWSTASGTLSAYRSDAALASTGRDRLRGEDFAMGADTVVLCAPSRHQRLVAPLLVGVLSSYRDAVYAAHARGVLPQPALCALDEVANIAPIPDLASMVSEGGGQGLVTVACLQDLSQARVRWGPEADGFLSLFPVTVVLPGIADRRTLELVSALAGDHQVPTRSRSVGGGRLLGTTSTSMRTAPKLPVDAVAHGTDGMALVLGATKRVSTVELTPSYRTLPWSALREPSSRSVPPRSR